MATQGKGFATRAIHHGYDPRRNEGALVPPLHLSSTFTFKTAQDGADIFAGEKAGHFYSRVSNPTTALLEARIAELEGTEAGLATASGMGAITSTLWSFLEPGDVLLTDATLYGCTHSFLEHGLKRFGIEVLRVDLSNEAALPAAFARRPKLVFFETPANPTLKLVDIGLIARLAKACGALTVVDNTYATPFITRPIELGANMVVHSATKYLGGHGDLVGGLVAGAQELVDQVRLVGMKDMTGAVMSPFNAMLVQRGLKTLELRMERHCASARIVAEWLESRSEVSTLHYPGLAGFAQKDLADRQMALPGGMIAMELHGGLESGRAVMDGVSMIGRAVSLGDAESLISHPASTTHSTYTPEELATHGIPEGLVRLSVGLETVEDILADLEQAFARLGSVDRAA